MKKWTGWKLGQKVNFIVNDFDCVKKECSLCEITVVNEDYAIATELCGTDKPMRLFIDEDTQDMFEEV